MESFVTTDEPATAATRFGARSATAAAAGAAGRREAARYTWILVAAVVACAVLASVLLPQ